MSARTALMFVIIAAFELALAALFRWEIPKANEQLLTYMLGQLSGFASAVVAFQFGTTKSSQDKTEAISNLAKGMNP
jgi:hypothetical protein